MKRFTAIIREGWFIHHRVAMYADSAMEAGELVLGDIPSQSRDNVLSHDENGWKMTVTPSKSKGIKPINQPHHNEQ